MSTISPSNTVSQPDWLTFTGISRGAARLAAILDRTPEQYSQCFLGNPRLADEVGVCIRHLNRLLKELADHGFIRLIRDYAIGSHRRIVLLWRLNNVPNERITCSISDDAPKATPEIHVPKPIEPWW